METLIAAGFSFVAGYITCIFYSLYRYNQHKKKVTSALAESLQEAYKRKTVKVEIVGEQMFAYEQGTERFLCEFNDFKDLDEKLIKLDPSIYWAVSYEDVTVVKNHIEKAKNAEEVAI